jgi:hypothetical protein
MATFWKFLPFLIKLALAVGGMGWFGGNVALSQVGGGFNAAQDWWKLLLPLVVGGVGTVTTVTHHYHSTNEALATVPSVSPATGITPDAVCLEYLGRIGAALMVKGDTVGLIRATKLSAHLNNKPVPTTDELCKS